MMKSITIMNKTNGKKIVSALKIANNFFTRLKGLIGSAPLQFQQGILISPCQQIHTHFMRYEIDVVFLDKTFNVIQIDRKMRPWKFSKFYKNAHYVLELQANGAMGISERDVLEIHT